MAGDDEEGSKEVVVAVAPKSRLKRANYANSKNVVKGNVKWMDLLGNDLTEVKEFAPRYMLCSLALSLYCCMIEFVGEFCMM